MGIILDSSILIAAERGRFDLHGLFQRHYSEEFYIASITASELLHGVERANTPERRLKRQAYVEGVLQKIPQIEFDLQCARHHAKLWASLESSGKSIGAYDMLIAAAALSESHLMATLNEDEFKRVPGLVLLDVSTFKLVP
jgi:tRNA(fMet)-specific endonuclease VapC